MCGKAAPPRQDSRVPRLPTYPRARVPGYSPAADRWPASIRPRFHARLRGFAASAGRACV